MILYSEFWKNIDKLIIIEIFRSNKAWLGHIEDFFQPSGDEIFNLCGFERVQVWGPLRVGMKEMAKEMPFPYELYDHLHDGRFGKLKLLKREPVRIQYRAENLFTSKVCCKGKKGDRRMVSI